MHFFRENKEMNNFISLLDTTLKMNKEDDKSEEDDEVRESKSHRRLMEPASRPSIRNSQKCFTAK